MLKMNTWNMSQDQTPNIVLILGENLIFRQNYLKY